MSNIQDLTCFDLITKSTPIERNTFYCERKTNRRIDLIFQVQHLVLLFLS